MNKYILLILVILLVDLNFFGCQPTTAFDKSSPSWYKTFGGKDRDVVDVVFSVQQTSDGGFIMAGYTGPYGAGKSDIYLVKADSEGNEQWSRTLGGEDSDSAYSVLQTNDGGYCIAGSTESYGDSKKDKMYVIKTDGKGQEQWSKIFDVGLFSYVKSVQQTSDSGYILAGTTKSDGESGLDMCLIKTDNEGREEWSKTFGLPGSQSLYSVEQTSDGFILGGYTFFVTKNNEKITGALLMKTDSSGNELWRKTFKDFTLPLINPISIQQTSDGGYVLAGSKGYLDLFVCLIKTDRDGNVQWEKTYSGSGDVCAHSVKQTYDGGYIIAGREGEWEDNAFLIKTDSKGKMQWAKTFGDTQKDDCAYSVQQTSDGGYILAGEIKYLESGKTVSDVCLIKIN